MSDQAQPVWSTVGKVSAVVGLVIGLVTIYRFVRPAEPSLLCRCSLATLDADMIYAETILAMANQREAARSGAIQTKLETSGVAPSDKGPRLFEIAADISASVLPDATKETFFAVSKDRSVVDCAIQNRGSKQATDVTLKTPFGVAGAVVGDAAVQKESLIGKGVSLGTVKPGDAFRLYIWTDHETIMTWSGDNFLLTYAEGTGEVDVAAQVYGVAAAAAALVRFVLNAPLSVLPLVFMLGVMLTLMLANFKQRCFAEGYRAAQKTISVQRELTDAQLTGDDEGAT